MLSGRRFVTSNHEPQRQHLTEELILYIEMYPVVTKSQQTWPLLASQFDRIRWNSPKCVGDRCQGSTHAP